MPHAGQQAGATPPGLRTGGVWVLLVICAALGCKPPLPTGPVAIHLYDLNTSRIMACTLSMSAKDRNQGEMLTRSTGGEAFYGEWVELARLREAEPDESGFDSSLPIRTLPSSPLSGSWDWATELGVDFEHFPDRYYSFTLAGDEGTLLNGFFVDNESSRSLFLRLVSGSLFRARFTGHGLRGAAKDNRGHRYRLIG